MKTSGTGRELWIYVGESDRYKGRPLSQQLVEVLKAEGLAGATVTRGTIGFGANSRIHTASIERLSEDLPVVVVVVDSRERIDRVLPRVEKMVTEGLITIHDVEVIKDTHSRTEPKAVVQR